MILDALIDQIPLVAKYYLNEPVTSPEVELAIWYQAKGKILGLDGQALEFYLKLWPIIGQEFASMVQQSILRGQLPHGMNMGIIALLHKYGAIDELTNYRPITLLKISYKIVAEALWRRLKFLLSDFMGKDQTSFLSMRYIFDNVLVQIETIEWSKESHQNLISLKLNFKKAFNIVSLPFFSVFYKN